jgi:hypothetical protein
MGYGYRRANGVAVGHLVVQKTVDLAAFSKQKPHQKGIETTQRLGWLSQWVFSCPSASLPQGCFGSPLARTILKMARIIIPFSETSAQNRQDLSKMYDLIFFCMAPWGSVIVRASCLAWHQKLQQSHNHGAPWLDDVVQKGHVVKFCEIFTICVHFC